MSHSGQHVDRMRFLRRVLAHLRPSPFEWKFSAAILFFVAALLAAEWWPNWIQWTYESCHLCGTRRFTRGEFEWYRPATTTQKSLTDFPIPPAHENDWYRYSFGHNRHLAWVAACTGSRYRDGRNSWTACKQARFNGSSATAPTLFDGE